MDNFMRELRRSWGQVKALPGNPAVLMALPSTPPCRLRLDGNEAREASCDIFEVSSQGVHIAIQGGNPVRQGQRGCLLIGPPEGDHYELPVDVSWVDPSPSIAVLGLAFPPTLRWMVTQG